MEASSYSECPTLPENLIIQILLRIPVKSLLRFKLLSKTWYNFLKTPYFISMHHKFNLGTTASQLLMCSGDTSRTKGGDHRDNHVFSFYSNDKSPRKLSPDFKILADPETYVHVVADSCNGIVCYYDAFFSIFLSNPVTRVFKRLPPTSFEEVKAQKWYQSGIAFDFDSRDIYDFKVLRLFCTRTEKEVNIEKEVNRPSNEGLSAEMFTLSSNTWKQLHWGLDDNLLFYDHGGYFCANSFHFLFQRHKTETRTIVCCDIRSERFTTMELPSVGDHQMRLFSYLLVFKEFLSSVSILMPPMNTGEVSLEIWIMKDYGVVESWTKLYKIGPSWGCVIPRCFWTEYDALLLAQWATNNLISFHLNTLHGEDVKIDGYDASSQLVVYKETLVSII